MRRAAKVDRTQPEIVTALRAAGASVQPLHMVGNGCPDLLVSFRNDIFLLECKDGAQPPSARKLTPLEAAWIERWQAPVSVVSSVDEALKAIGLE